MNNLEMFKFGRTLTDRPYGHQIAQKILQTETFPLALDFRGVISLGSSFGDEILSAILSKAQKNLIVLNANDAIRSCLDKVSTDLGLTVEYK